MGISVIGGAAPASSLNRSQVFTGSGNFTVPAGVTSIHASIRGGNGTGAGFVPQVFSNGVAGGNTVFNGVTAVGGMAGYTLEKSASNVSGVGQGPGNVPSVVNFFSVVSPGQVLSVTIGAGTGSFAVISWAV